ncbi:MAG TPA: alpha/beta hydrolase [Alphaproteobacteria bacterium]
MSDVKVSDGLVYGKYSQSELDNQYNQGYLVPDSSVYKARKKAGSERVTAHFRGLYDISYGDSPDETLDVFPAAQAGGPTMVFLHGGAWKNGTKEGSRWVAEVFVPRGVNVVVVNFSLAPQVSLGEQVRQAAAAVTWTYNHARDYGGDPERVFVTGHSSGGHLAGVMAVNEWTPPGLVKGVGAFSGMFDLAPVRLSWRNSYLDLTPEETLRLSAIRHIPSAAPGLPLIVGYGTGELDEFQRQSHDFVLAWRAQGRVCEEQVFPGANHFDVQEQFSLPEGTLVQSMLKMMGVAKG